MEIGGPVVVGKESNIAVDIGFGRGGSCGGGDRAASLPEDRVAIPAFDLFMYNVHSEQRSSILIVSELTKTISSVSQDKDYSI